MKKGIVVGFIASLLSANVFASDFCDGFKSGFITGYKQASGGVYDPLAPYCPTQPYKNYNDPKSDFEHGYIIGLKIGLAGNRPLDRPLDSLGEFNATHGLAAGYANAVRAGQQQELIQQKIENQRLQNEILRRQLEAQETPRPPQPTAAPTPQYGRDSIAAEPGDAAGLTNLGMRYAKGDGVPKDSTKAVELFRKAASQGDVGAMNNLGVMYAKGAGVEQSHTQAVWFYRLAAEKGHPQAQANLGYAYEAGWGVNRDYNAALVWYRKAASLGHEVAKQRIAGIENTLSQQRLKPQTNVAVEMKARLLARNEGCEIASIKNVQPPTGFSYAYEISCSDSSIRKYNCNSSECRLVSVVPPMGSQTKSTSKWPNP